MKKFLIILVTGILWYNIGFAETISLNKLHYKGHNNDQTLVRYINVTRLFDRFFGWNNRYPCTDKDLGSGFVVK